MNGLWLSIQLGIIIPTDEVHHFSEGLANKMTVRSRFMDDLGVPPMTQETSWAIGIYRMENQLTGSSVLEVLWQIQKLIWSLSFPVGTMIIEKSGGMERCDVVHLSDFSATLGLIGGDWNMNGLWLSIQLGISSSQLMNSYFSRWLLHSNQLNMGMGPQVLTTNEDQITVISPTAIVSNVRMPMSWANHVDVGIFHGRYPLVN